MKEGLIAIEISKAREDFMEAFPTEKEEWEFIIYFLGRVSKYFRDSEWKKAIKILADVI